MVLRRMMRHLDRQTESVDQQLTELEGLLPGDYVHPDDVQRRAAGRQPAASSRRSEK